MHRVLDALRASDYYFPLFIFLLDVPGAGLDALFRSVVVEDKASKLAQSGGEIVYAKGVVVLLETLDDGGKDVTVEFRSEPRLNFRSVWQFADDESTLPEQMLTNNDFVISFFPA